MRVGFAGTPEFAAAALAAILDAGFNVPLVLTQPDRPKGRGLALAASPVKTLALARGLAVQQPASLRAEASREPLLAISLDVLVVAAYGLILPPAILAWPRRGGLNIHASLLPRWRGAAPIQRAILAGDAETGVTIMQMDAGLDTGAMLSTVRVPIGERETAGSLHDRLAHAGATAIVATLEALRRGDALHATPQPGTGITYAAKLGPEDANLDWTLPARALDRVVRAMSPAPGAFTVLAGERWKLWEAHPVSRSAQAVPGTVLAVDADATLVQCGEDALALTTMQPAGGRRLSARDVAAGRRMKPGDRFVSPVAASRAADVPDARPPK